MSPPRTRSPRQQELMPPPNSPPDNPNDLLPIVIRYITNASEDDDDWPEDTGEELPEEAPLPVDYIKRPVIVYRASKNIIREPSSPTKASVTMSPPRKSEEVVWDEKERNLEEFSRRWRETPEEAPLPADYVKRPVIVYRASKNIIREPSSPTKASVTMSPPRKSEEVVWDEKERNLEDFSRRWRETPEEAPLPVDYVKRPVIVYRASKNIIREPSSPTKASVTMSLPRNSEEVVWDEKERNLEEFSRWWREMIMQEKMMMEVLEKECTRTEAEMEKLSKC